MAGRIVRRPPGERSGDALISYPLGKLDAGSTYLQKYTGDSVTASAIAGPYVGSPASHFKYIAMPVTHDILLLVRVTRASVR